MYTGHGGYGTSQMPLAGAILCCTSIPPEQRTELATIGSQMGATIKLDLTSDVTHLVVGNINSAKYRYVAKSREDVKVLLPEWLEALRTVWMQGGDVDVAALEEQYRLPTFYGLKICLTGFDNPEQRKHIQDTVSQLGAEYHGDLTKSVTHLIAAAPLGKKYEHAVNWRMKIITWEWFEQSRERGMALDEAYYNPTIPVEERGKGAWERRRSTSPALGKRSRDAGQAEMVNILRRKLRRSASSRLGSQSEALWAGITAGGFERQKDEEDDWTEANLVHADPPVADIAREQSSGGAHPGAQPTKDSVPQRVGPFEDEYDGIFRGRLVFPHGFDQSKTNILRDHLDGNGAIVIRNPADLDRYPSDDLGRGFLVIPHDIPADLLALPDGAGDFTLVTNWWVERCLHGKRLVDPLDCMLNRPFNKLSISGFNGLTINITGFTGIELLQVTKAVALFGAIYDETLTPKTSVMICNTQTPNPEKSRFAAENGIPAVHAAWFWDSISDGLAQKYKHYLLSTTVPQPRKPKPKRQASFPEIPTALLSEEDSLKLRQKKTLSAKSVSKSRAGRRLGGTLELSLSGPSTPLSTTESSTRTDASAHTSSLEHDAQLLGAFDGACSFPLQDINPSVNSPRRPSTSSHSSEAPTKPLPAQRKSRLAEEPTPDSVIPAADSMIPADSEEPLQDLPEPAAKDYSNIMSKLLADRKLSTPIEKETEKSRRRRRPLGRAQSTRSNASTADDKASGHSSAHRVDEGKEHADEGMDMVHKAFQLPQPSQELGWDSPGAQKVRERMILAMGGKVEEGLNVLEGIGVVKDAVRPDGLGGGRPSRKRRG